MSPAILPHSDNLANADPSAPSEKDRSLKIFIVGAGIAGLAAAIGLHREGHEVEVFTTQCSLGAYKIHSDQILVIRTVFIL